LTFFKCQYRTINTGQSSIEEREEALEGREGKKGGRKEGKNEGRNERTKERKREGRREVLSPA